MKTMEFDPYRIKLLAQEDIEAYYQASFYKPAKEVLYYTGTQGPFDKDQIRVYLKRVVADPTRKDFIILEGEHIVG